jgi:5-methyltetrahydrofolate--homocysteine methyltransferase
MPAPEADKLRLPIERARANRMPIDWAAYQPPKPTFTGTRVFRTYDVADLVPFIDWTPFFQTWELKGRFPAILEDAEQGAAARQLYEDAQAMLKRIVEERWFNPKAVIGFWPANAVGDDIRLYTGESRTETLATFHGLRQQLSKRDGRPNLCLSDFVAPSDTGLADYVGGFVVTAGLEEVRIAEKFERANDDYRSILVKALADRIAEAFAERMHQRVRKEFWAYAPDEAISNEDLVREEYRGIRPGARLSRPSPITPRRNALQPAAGRAPHRREAHRNPTPCGRARRCRASTSPIRRRITSASPRWSAIRSRITPRARA